LRQHLYFGARKASKKKIEHLHRIADPLVALLLQLLWREALRLPGRRAGK
jgi:hypothetical protein